MLLSLAKCIYLLCRSASLQKYRMSTCFRDDNGWPSVHVEKSRSGIFAKIHLSEDGAYARDFAFRYE